jgi:hypothetical protein
VAVLDPGSCYAGVLAELALACDRQYVLDGVFEDPDEPGYTEGASAATVVLTAGNDGPYPMGNGLSRLRSRFWGVDAELDAVRARFGEPLDAAALDSLGLVTLALDDIDFADELRIVLEERASLSPDALTGQPPLRRPGDRGDQGVRPAHRVAELDLPAAQRLRGGGSAAPVRHRAARGLRREAGLSRGSGTGPVQRRAVPARPPHGPR